MKKIKTSLLFKNFFEVILFSTGLVLILFRNVEFIGGLNVFCSMRICFMTNNHLVLEWYSLSFLRIGSGVHQWCAYRQQCHIVQRFILCVFGQQRYTVQGDKEHCARFEHLFGNYLQSLIQLLLLYCLLIAFVLGYLFSLFFIFFIRTSMLS